MRTSPSRASKPTVAALAGLAALLLGAQPASSAVKAAGPPATVVDASRAGEEVRVAPVEASSTATANDPDSSPEALALEYCPATVPGAGAAGLDARPPHRHGYCRCSCGYPCTSSADCGGVSCDPFITCC